MEGLLKEGKEILDEDADPAIEEIAVVEGAERVEKDELGGLDWVWTWDRRWLRAELLICWSRRRMKNTELRN